MRVAKRRFCLSAPNLPHTYGFGDNLLKQQNEKGKTAFLPFSPNMPKGICGKSEFARAL